MEPFYFENKTDFPNSLIGSAAKQLRISDLLSKSNKPIFIICKESGIVAVPMIIYNNSGYSNNKRKALKTCRTTNLVRLYGKTFIEIFGKSVGMLMFGFYGASFFCIYFGGFAFHFFRKSVPVVWGQDVKAVGLFMQYWIPLFRLKLNC